MRLRRIKNFDERSENVSSLFLKDPVELKGDWKKFFGNNNPIHLEIGMGKGNFINTLAKNNPDINFIGMEKSDTITILASERLGERVPNLIYLNGDAARIREFFSDDEIDMIYLNFSDPWPKARHEKRRLTSANFLNDFSLILKSKGLIEFKTDNLGLFDYSVESFKENGFILNVVDYDLHKTNPNVVMTEYEVKFSSMGNKINFLQATNKR